MESKTEKKYKAARRAQFRLQQTFERIDFEEDVLKLEVEELKKNLSAGVVPQIEVETS